MTPVTVTRGDGPLILGQPHGGTFVPKPVWAQLNGTGKALADTDWHIGKLYDGLLSGVTIVAANFHRYVIDPNRDPTGQSLYPGQNTTGLCPTTDFGGRAIYREGAVPDANEIAERCARWHMPYHAALQSEVERVKATHGVAVVYDCHSIRSRIPFLFDGELPALNIGTDNGKTCASGIEARAHEIAGASSFASVLNGRFRGGWTTRHYGQPHTGVHAIQMEIAQSAYLDTEQSPWSYSGVKAEELRRTLKDILQALAEEALETTA